VSKTPIIRSQLEDEEIREVVNSAVNCSKADWDNFETSWDFQTHPLLRGNFTRLADAFECWRRQADEAFHGDDLLARRCPDGGFKMVEYDHTTNDPETQFADMQQKKPRKQRVTHVEQDHISLNPTKGNIQEGTRSKPKQKQERPEDGISEVSDAVYNHFEGRLGDVVRLLDKMPDYTNLEEYLKTHARTKTSDEIIQKMEKMIKCL
jgi:hypothetical protein